jgi:hypothetical protein
MDKSEAARLGGFAAAASMTQEAREERARTAAYGRWKGTTKEQRRQAVRAAVEARLARKAS